MARPTDYRPEYVDQAEKLCKLGATDKELGDFFDVSEQTINNWKNEYPEFFESIKKGKEIADMNVASKLYDRATGAKIKVQQAFKMKEIHYDGLGKKISESERIEIVELEQEQAPDTTAGIFWLKNRKPKLWRDKQEVEHDVTDRLGSLLAKSQGTSLPIGGNNDNDSE